MNTNSATMKKPSNVHLTDYLKHGLIKRSRLIINLYYRTRLLLKDPKAHAIITNFRHGVSDSPMFRGNLNHYAKYFTVYNIVRTTKPNYVLECGPGVTTPLIEQALKKNGVGKLVSIEEYEDFYNIIKETVDPQYTTLVLSPTEHTTYDGIEGDKYTNIPDHPYDFMFVDGPTTKTVDLDAFYILDKRKIPVLVDCRVQTVKALKTKYNGYHNKFTKMGYINF